MYNELLFILHSLLVSTGALVALWLGQAALVAYVCLQCIIANIMVLKQITLFGLTATCSDAYTIGATLGLNLLQEYYGRAATYKAIWTNFALLIMYALITQLHVAYIPYALDTTQHHYSALFMFIPRIVTASFLVYLFVQLLDYTLYGALKHYFGNRYLVLRNYASIIVCQGIDTVLFSFLGLYGLVHNIGEIICISYAVKIVAIIIATPLVALSGYVFRK